MKSKEKTTQMNRIYFIRRKSLAACIFLLLGCNAENEISFQDAPNRIWNIDFGSEIPKLKSDFFLTEVESINGQAELHYLNTNSVPVKSYLTFSSINENDFEITISNDSLNVNCFLYVTEYDPNDKYILYYSERVLKSIFDFSTFKIYQIPSKALVSGSLVLKDINDNRVIKAFDFYIDSTISECEDDKVLDSLIYANH